MFVVIEADAAAIRIVFEQEGELSAAIEVRRLFPGITDNVKAREHARIIAGWQPLPPARRSHGIQYQIIDTVMACAIQADTVRAHPLLAWIIMRGLPEYPGSLVARLVNETPRPYIVLGHTLAEVQAQLPPGLERSDRQPADLPDVVEAWFPSFRAA
jgi:hypothetical protein